MESDEMRIKRLENEKFNLKAALLLLLDQVDYTDGACSPVEPVGGVLDKSVIARCRAAIVDAA